MRLIFIICLVISTLSAQHDELYKIDYDALKGYQKAYFASGCFWCVEAIYESVKGVKEVVSGYSGGNFANPTYELISTGLTHHAEAVEVYYDENAVSFATLVKVFFGSHDPTLLNRQGPDVGSQYRSIAFYQNAGEKRIIENYIKKLEAEKIFDNPIVTEVKKFDHFYPAESYHQDYEKRNPHDRYIIFISKPRINRFKSKFPELLKDDED